jgi:RNA-directed DNA polymerase
MDVLKPSGKPFEITYKRLRTIKKAAACWQRVTSQYPRLFAHWAWAHGSWWSG